MYRSPKYYASKKTTLYDLLPLYSDLVEFVVQDKNGKIVDCFMVKEAKTLPYHRLFDEIVVERTYNAGGMRLLVKLDYMED